MSIVYPGGNPMPADYQASLDRDQRTLTIEAKYNASPLYEINFFYYLSFWTVAFGPLGNSTQIARGGSEFAVVPVPTTIPVALEDSWTQQEYVLLAINDLDSNYIRMFLPVHNAAGSTANLVFTGDGEDEIVLTGSGRDVVDGHSGNDMIDSGAGGDRLSGGDGNDQLYGGAGADALAGGAGNDLLDGGGGADRMVGGDGDDRYVVDDRGDVIADPTGAGVDTVVAGLSWRLQSGMENLVLGGNDEFDGSGNAQANSITGNGADNRLFGFDGDDTLDGGTGYDTMVGGRGDDFYLVDVIAERVVERADEGHDTVISTVLDTYRLPFGVEDLMLRAGQGAVGNDEANVILFDAGPYSYFPGTSFRFAGGGGDDQIRTGALDDVLIGGTGADRMIGLSGDDLYFVDDVGDIIEETAFTLYGPPIPGANYRLLGGTDTVRSSVDYTLPAYVENLALNGDGLRGAGNVLANVIHGSRGADTLLGLQGDDDLRGDAGNDVLDGGRGADRMEGGAGVDILTGRLGADRFVIRSGDTGVGAAADRITDFTQAQGDLIDLREIDANTLSIGNGRFDFIGQSGFTGAAGELRFELAGSYTSLQADTDGDASADFEIRLSGAVTLTAADLVL